MVKTLMRTSITLTLVSDEKATFLEEMLWTLDGVESVTYRLDGEEYFQGLQVIGNAPNLLSQIQQLCEEYGLQQAVSIQPPVEISEADWAECWKQYWHVNRILPHLVIQPSWEPFTPLPKDIVLKLDPGSAFGTGTHDTTQLMLFVLNEIMHSAGSKPQNLLDVGTGSGILAIYGAKLGISDCVAIDNDSHAVDVACENIALNGVAEQITGSTQTVGEMAGQKQFDLVLANILTPILKDLMPDFEKVLSPQGILVMSGITRRQSPQILESMQIYHLDLVRFIQKGDWVALVCKKKS